MIALVEPSPHILSRFGVKRQTKSSHPVETGAYGFQSAPPDGPPPGASRAPFILESEKPPLYHGVRGVIASIFVTGYFTFPLSIGKSKFMG